MEEKRIALVTGAAGGLGAAIAGRLCADGYRVAIVDRDGEGARAEAARHGGAMAFACDVADEASVGAMLEQVIAAFGAAPGALVNNAGIVRFGDILTHSVADFRAVLEVNLIGAFIVSQALARHMVARGGGAIVNITSLNAFAPSPDAGAYPAAKAGLAKLTEQMALSLGPRGVRVNSVAPGFIDAGMSTPIYRDAGVKAARGASVPAGRIGEAEDVAAAVAFLLSDEASYIHAQHLLVDGGVFCSLKNQMPRKPPSGGEGRG
ncbi:MAG: glucose 1-dehydrogenase [Rhizobiales bacterium]|nr:glucose 1-dehydrogenase [Hyphomicrobiales bacterium]